MKRILKVKNLDTGEILIFKRDKNREIKAHLPAGNFKLLNSPDDCTVTGRGIETKIHLNNKEYAQQATLGLAE